MGKKVKHLELIQATIGRQANNSFLLKGWVIAIIVGLFTFAVKDETFKRVLSVYALLIIFWLLDSYYLWQEGLFRKLFDQVRDLKEDDIDFNMDVKKFARQKDCTWLDVALSKTLLIFYVSLMIFTLVLFYLQ